MPGGVHGLLEGNPQQLLAQLYGVVVTLVWSGTVTFIILKVISALVPLRVRHEDEVVGLDVSLHGEALQESAINFCAGEHPARLCYSPWALD